MDRAIRNRDRRNHALAVALLSMSVFLGLHEPATATARGVRLAPDGKPITGVNWLVLIAVDEYLHQPSLKGPRADAGALKSVLLDRYDFEPQHLIELYDSKATKRGIQSLFRDLGKRIGQDDSILIYYAGHGHTDEFSKTGYWIPHDGGVDPIEKDRWLPNAEIRGSIAALSSARHILLIADSCFSGDLLSEQRGIARTIDNAFFARAYQGVSRQVMTSGANEPVQDTGIHGHSAFSYHLSDTLRRNHEPYLDPMQLYTRLRTGVSGQLPLLGALRGAGHQDGAAYLFFLRTEVDGELPDTTASHETPGAPSLPSGPTSTVSPELSRLTQENRDFEHVSRELDTEEGWTWFLQRYPEGEFADRARARLEAVRSLPTETPAGQPGPSPATVAETHRTLRLAAEGMGGAARWREVKTFYTSVRNRVTYQGAMIEAQLTNWVVWPDRIRTEISSQLGRETTVVFGSQGFREIGFLATPLGAEEIHEQLAYLNRAGFTLMSQLDNPALETRELGARRVGGESCNAVEAAFRGETSTLCVTEDGRVLSQSFNGRHPLSGAPGRIEQFYSDYRPAGPFRVPYRAELRFNGATVIETTTLEAAFNVPVGPEKFQPSQQ